MKKVILKKILFLLLCVIVFSSYHLKAQTNEVTKTEITSVIKKATKFFDEKVSVNGGYVWNYLPDLSRRWGELEATPSMVWIQGPGTVEMGNTFLDIYEETNDEYYYQLAKKSAHALIKGQLTCGGWNYLIDYAEEDSLKKWYDTIGKNAWRMEEFQHYYGNATFDDGSANGAAEFLLRFYLTKNDSTVKPALDKAINFMLESQYPNGAWSQRYPKTGEFNKNGNPDYSLYYTFNDEVIWNNTKFLITCYFSLHDQKFLEPIKRAMDFFILSQYKKPQAGWGQQYNMNLEPAMARSYEPASLDPIYSLKHVEMLIKFFEMTGDKKYLLIIPAALDWIETTKLNAGDNDSLCVIPKFVELETNKPLYTHRIGANVKFGKYFYNYDAEHDLAHYHSTRKVNISLVKNEFRKVVNGKEGVLLKDTLVIPFVEKSMQPLEIMKEVERYLILPSEQFRNYRKQDINFINKIISSLDEENRWLVPHAYTSNQYIGEPSSGDSTSLEFCDTEVGDKFDTSPYRDNSDQKYISTFAYIINVKILLRYFKDINN